MRSPSVLTLTAFVLCSLLTSAPYVQADGTTITEVQHCYTKQGSGSVSPVPTSYAYNTVSLQLPVVVGKTVTKTVTPSPTATASSTVTTSVQKTSTVTAGGFPVCTLTSTPVTTKTATSTVTTTSTSTVTKTDFTTEITSTRTVFNSAKPGYTPLATQLSQQRVSYGKRGAGEEGRDEARKRRSASAAHGASLQARSAVRKEKKRAGKSSSPLFGGKKYPQSVNCQGVVKKVSYVTQTVPVAVATATITAAAPTKTNTNTVTVVGSTTQTKTVCSFGALLTTTKTAATSTATVVATTTATTATTTTTTTTQTVQAEATETAYRQCRPNNVISRADDRAIVGIESEFDASSLITADDNALDCCIACYNAPTCAVYAFAPAFSPGQQCYVIAPQDPATCPWPYQLDLSADEPMGLTVGNGDCSNLNGLNYLS